MTTKKDIIASFNLKESQVKQIGAKQLFIVDTKDGRLLLSYYTVVGYYDGTDWHLTKYKYSTTTSKQLNQFARDNPGTKWIDDKYLNNSLTSKDSVIEITNTNFNPYINH